MLVYNKNLAKCTTTVHHTRYGTTTVEALLLQKPEDCRSGYEWGASARRRSRRRSSRCRFHPMLLLICLAILASSIVPIAEGLGSMSPLAAVSRDVFHGSSPLAAYSCTVCVILAGRKQLIRCWDSRDPRRIFSVGNAGVSYVGVAGGDGFMCGLRESTGQPFCWNLRDEKNSSSSWRRSQQQHRLSQKRYVQIAVGESHVCALRRVNGSIHCWRLKGWDQQHPRRSSSTSTSPHGFAFLSLTAGGDFTCGLTNGSQMMCWGVELNLNVSTMYSSISAGRRHVCGIRVADGAVECFGNYPLQKGGSVSPPENWAFSSLALGASHSCGLRTETHEAVCWGDNSTAQLAAPQGVAFASITASDFYTCGIKETDLSTVCWGRGFDNSSPKKNRSEFLFPPQLKTAPGICTNSPCPVGSFSFHGSNATMGVGGNVCANRNQFVCLACSNSTCQGPPAAAMTPLSSSSSAPPVPIASPSVPIASPSHPKPFPCPIPSTQQPPSSSPSSSLLKGGSSNSSLRRTMLATISLGVLGGVGILVSLVALICCCFLNRKQQQQIPKLQNCCTGKFACNANARRRSSSNNSRVHHSEENPGAAADEEADDDEACNLAVVVTPMRLSPLHGSSINRYMSCLISLSSGACLFSAVERGGSLCNALRIHANPITMWSCCCCGLLCAGVVPGEI